MDYENDSTKPTTPLPIVNVLSGSDMVRKSRLREDDVVVLGYYLSGETFYMPA